MWPHLEKGSFTGQIKDLEMRSSWISRWALNLTVVVSLKGTEEEMGTGGNGHVQMEAEIRMVQPQAWGHQQLEEAGKILP